MRFCWTETGHGHRRESRWSSSSFARQINGLFFMKIILQIIELLQYLLTMWKWLHSFTTVNVWIPVELLSIVLYPEPQVSFACSPTSSTDDRCDELHPPHLLMWCGVRFNCMRMLWRLQAWHGSHVWWSDSCKALSWFLWVKLEWSRTSTHDRGLPLLVANNSFFFSRLTLELPSTVHLKRYIFLFGNFESFRTMHLRID